MVRKCEGPVHRNGKEYLCHEDAVYYVRSNLSRFGTLTCRHHLAKVVDKHLKNSGDAYQVTVHFVVKAANAPRM